MAITAALISMAIYYQKKFEIEAKDVLKDFNAIPTRMKKEKIITIQGIRSSEFLPRAIQFFMWLYVVRVNIFRFFSRKPYLKFIKTCNHWSVVFKDRNKEYEAIGRGVVVRSYSLYYHQYAKEWDVPVQDIESLEEYCIQQVNKGYEYLNFFWHILKVMGFRWLGSYNDNHHSCIELANRVLQMAGIEEINKYDNPYQTQVKLEKLFTGTVVKE
jgi:hypothetical protein